MFERFTERARQVVVLAQEEARTLTHNYIGTEHILLGLLREEEGLAARVLESVGITLEGVRGQVVEIVGRGQEITGGQIPFTARAKRVLELSLTEALKLGHNYIGTEHLLLGLVRESEGEGTTSWTVLALGQEKEGVAIRILLKFDADPERIRNELLRVLSDPRPTAAPGFFEPPPVPPDPPAPRRYRMPEWMGPPENVVPGVAALELLLVNTERHAVWIGQAEAYPTGVVVRVDLVGREPARPGLESGTGTWRFGVQFSDGRKATTFGLGAFSRPLSGAYGPTFSPTPNPPESSPAGLLLRSQESGGSRSKWRQAYWLWPLPPSGDLTLVCEWANAGIDMTTVTISADLLRDAASRARELWPAPDLSEWPRT